MRSERLYVLAIFSLACGGEGTRVDEHPGPAMNTSAILAATSKSAALEAGAAVLREGGSAVDAALTIALDQCTLTGGSWNSFAGILTMVVYDGGNVSALSAGYSTFAGELDPLTIPTDAPSGRTALVPGFFDGVLEAHRRFGRLPLERVAAPAITHAELGFVVDGVFEATLDDAAPVLRRLPETRAVFTRGDGQLYRRGDTFRQPRLAATLRRFVSEGRAYVYEGEWADHFVAAVRADGGAPTREDLAAYHAAWTTPLRIPYGGTEIALPGVPNRGGSTVAEAFVLADAARLRERGRWDESGDALYWLARVTQVSYLSGYLPLYGPDLARVIERELPDVGWSVADRLDPARARRMIDLVESGRWDAAVQAAGASNAAIEASSHSDAIVVADHSGNIVALTHTINSSNWGKTGIIVDGVMIPDSAATNRPGLATVGPGARLPDPLNPLLAFRDGRPVLAASTVGSVHYAQLERTHAVLAWALSPERAVVVPAMSGSPYRESVPPGSVPSGVLADVAARGLVIREGLDENGLGWIGIARSNGSAAWQAGVEPGLALLGGGTLVVPPPR